ncbi:MAG: maltose alpha-D-glucosyltransferase [Calditrichia bacterium]
MNADRAKIEDDPLWYKDAIIYEVHIKSFYDSNDDGIGDIPGLIEKLDYLEILGVTAIWLLPFYPSPLKDDGYDIADYFNIHPDYGTLRDFRRLLKEAHRRGLRIITELVVNHTSDQHKWFQRARQAKPGSVWRNYYVWSDSPDKYSDARIIFKDFETSNWTWDPMAKAYYWHRFYSHQPDLNFENPRVQREILRVLDYWFEMGVDGLRLDAIPYLYEREGTNCENLEETHRFLKKLRRHVDEKFRNRMLLAEANQWPEDAVAYLGKGDECHMAFHFPVMPRLFMGLRMEDRFPVIDILEQTPRIPKTCQWAMFLRNHDELTLEMVTDEERDYMYRIFAQDPRARINLGIRRRLAPLLDNNRRKIELMNILLFSLPGTPVIYYGDEIGMGDNYYLGDRDGVRTPMQWSADRNAGFSKANPQKLYLPVIIDSEYHFQAINVEIQEQNLSSHLWWMKRVIAMRKHFKAFSRGDLKFINSDNPKVLTFLRTYGEEQILVVINLSRFAQVLKLNVAEFVGHTPEEIFSQNMLPVIGEDPYMITLGPYGHYWLRLEKEEDFVQISEETAIPEIKVKRHWQEVLNGEAVEMFENRILPKYIRQCRWFGGKARALRKVGIAEKIMVPRDGDYAGILLLQVDYALGAPQTYVLAVAYSPEVKGERLLKDSPQSIISRIKTGEEHGFLFDALYSEAFRAEILQMVAKRKKFRGRTGELVAVRSRNFAGLLGKNELPMPSRVLKAEQSNSSVLYGNAFFLKLYRRVEEGINPDPEMVRFLSEAKNFENVPAYAGSLEYHHPGSDPYVISLLQGFTPNHGDAWTLTLDAVGRYFERVLSQKEELPELDLKLDSMFDVAFDTIPPVFQNLIGGIYFEQAGLLGQRTGEMHRMLASSRDPGFEPESFSTLYQKSLYQSLRTNARRGLEFLEANLKALPEKLRPEAEKILALEKKVLKQYRLVTSGKISALKIRIHGDYHLGQVLSTGKDFIIIDFEGEPVRSPGERRLKYSAFRDVAGMIRSFHYAAYNVFFQRTSIRPEDAELLEPWIEPWFYYVSGSFLHSYMEAVEGARFVPKEREELAILLNIFLLDKSIYEIGYELNNRPDWVKIPIEGIKLIVKDFLE